MKNMENRETELYPMVSIIIPLYNTAEYIKDTLLSIQKQDFSDYQIILVDDGSTDSSLEVARTCASADSRISVYHKENGGQSSARNLGMKYAEGKYILFIDSDDQLAPNVLKGLVGNLEENNLDVLRAKLLIIQDGLENKIDHVDFPNQIMSGKDKLIKGNVSYSICAHMYRREFLEEHKIKFIEGVFHEDMDFIVRAYVYAQRVMDIDSFFYLYFRRSGSTTNTVSAKRVFDYYSVAESVLELVKSIDDKELYEGFFREYLAFMFSRAVNMCTENNLPISKLMSDEKRRRKILFCIEGSNQKRYKLQGIILKCKLYRMYTLIYQIREKKKGK